MNRNVLLLLMAVVIALSMWSCEDKAPTGLTGGGSVKILGYISDANTLLPVANAKVSIAGIGFGDSTHSDASGFYSFEFQKSTVVDPAVILSVVKPGYVSLSFPVTLSTDTLINVAVHVDRSTSGTVSGVVRDSASLYPLRGVSLLLSLPGYTDSSVTAKEGAFQFAADLIDRDSLPVNLTLFKSGYKLKHVAVTLRRAQDVNLGDLLMAVDVASTVVQISGRVFDSKSNLPINNASVQLQSTVVSDSSPTSFDGSYLFTVDPKGLSSVPFRLLVSKNGYSQQSVNGSVDAGHSTTVNFYLIRDTVTSIRDSSGTGLAHSIAFISQSAKEISVAGVGGVESSILTWEVHDSLGFPIDIDHSDTVFFGLVGTPVNGGAYVSPSRAITNVSGRVATTVNSGTVSGVLQFIASVRRESDGVVIRSSPVIITVNAGLPDQAHFSIGPAAHNFAGYDWINRTDDITVQVGDKFSNPVRVGTAVYFNTTGGIIDASGFTDLTSHATVTLYSGNPLPRAAELSAFPLLYGDGTGYTWVRALTLGEGTVSDSTLVLMSASSGIYIDTAGVSLSMDSGSCITVPIRISDRFGNPLSAGTRITTQLQFSPPTGTNWSVLAAGLPEDPLDDFLIRGPGRTQFSLTICDGTPGGTPDRMPFTVTIRVTSPNGNTSMVLNGSVGP